MASHPPQAGCCTTGIKQQGTPKGNFVDLGGIDTYISHPLESNTRTSKKPAILILTDVLGHRFINSQLIADQFAAQGHFVVMPDLFHGDAVPELLPDGYPKFEDWLNGPESGSGSSGHLPHNVDPIVEMVIREMRGTLGVERICAAGYCFGAKYVVRHLKPQTGIDVGYLVHPTMVTEEELVNVQGPLCIDAAEIDPVFPRDMRQKSEDLLIKTGQPYQITVFGGVEHGFAVRADYSKPRVRYARDQSFEHCIQWFEEFGGIS